MKQEGTDKFSLRGKVFHKIREDILSGKYKDNEELKEVAIGEELGVSRTPVRGALHRLAEDGLVEISPNRGAVVVGINADDLVDIYSIRMRLEGLASSLAAKRISEEELKALSDSVELAEFYIQRKDTEHLKELDTAFHSIIYKASGNRLLSKTLSELHKKIRAYRKLSMATPGRLEKTALEHREIYKAIADGDSEKADKLTSLHIERALENILLAVEKDKSSK